MINTVKNNLTSPNFTAYANIYTKPKVIKEFSNIFNDQYPAMLGNERSNKMAESILKIFSTKVLASKKGFIKYLRKPSKKLINPIKEFVKNTFGADYKISSVFKMKDKSGNHLIIIDKAPNASLDSAMIIKNKDGSILTIQRDPWPINDSLYDSVNSVLSTKKPKK